MLLSLAFRFVVRFSIIREKAGRVKEFMQKISPECAKAGESGARKTRVDFIDKLQRVGYNKHNKGAVR